VSEQRGEPGGGATVALDVEPARVGIFDGHEPPSAERIADCVHCGFCLPTCPTYLLWGEEMDSPRGRIYLMKTGRDGTVELDDTYVRHFDQCLGCMACVTACPSGVRYDELIEATRPQVERHFTRSPADRAFRALIFTLFPHPARLRVAAALGWAYQRLGLRALLHAAGLAARLPALEDSIAIVGGIFELLSRHVRLSEPPEVRELVPVVERLFAGQLAAAAA
jgi:glycolate oxidase iron-sulfur subunit